MLRSVNMLLLPAPPAHVKAVRALPLQYALIPLRSACEPTTPLDRHRRPSVSRRRGVVRCWARRPYCGGGARCCSRRRLSERVDAGRAVAGRADIERAVVERLPIEQAVTERGAAECEGAEEAAAESVVVEQVVAAAACAYLGDGGLPVANGGLLRLSIGMPMSPPPPARIEAAGGFLLLKEACRGRQSGCCRAAA